MKKLYIIAAIALVASAACTQLEIGENAPEVKIGYQVANYAAQTKAGETSFLTELSGLGVSSNQAFSSSAFINADNGNGGHTFNAFFNPNPESIVWDGTAKTWSPASKDYYWPKSPKSNIDFFSWYDYEGVAPTLTYSGTSATMVWSNKAVAGKSDILFADIAFHQTKNSKTYKLDGVSEGVPTLFHHALAQVKFTAKIKDDCYQIEDSKHSGNYHFWEVKLSNVAFAANKVQTNGTLTLTGADPDASDAAASITPWTSAVWTNASSPAYVTNAWFQTNEALGTTALTETAANLIPDTYMGSGYIAVRPQTIGDDVTLGLTMTITHKYGTAIGSATTVSTETINVTAYAPTAPYTATGIQLNQIGSISAWEMNHKYTYNLIIDPTTTTILYDPAVEAWAAETSKDVNIPE